jgi:hypothetical protein
MNTPRNILVVARDRASAEAGCGAALARHKKAGAKVTVVTGAKNLAAAVKRAKPAILYCDPALAAAVRAACGPADAARALAYETSDCSFSPNVFQQAAGKKGDRAKWRGAQSGVAAAEAFEQLWRVEP